VGRLGGGMGAREIGLDIRAAGEEGIAARHGMFTDP
jgi:hypothetical protein